MLTSIAAVLLCVVNQLYVMQTSVFKLVESSSFNPIVSAESVNHPEMPKVKVLASMMVSGVAPMGVYVFNTIPQYQVFQFSPTVWVLLIVYALAVTVAYRFPSSLQLKPDLFQPQNAALMLAVSGLYSLWWLVN